ALISYLGNRYGHAWSAEAHAKSVLDGLHEDRWRYYLEECLPVDRRVLEKLTEPTPLDRWYALVKEYNLANARQLSGDVKRLLEACDRGELGAVMKMATRMLVQTPASEPA